MPQTDILSAVTAPSCHRFTAGDEVILPDGSTGVINALLPVSHYRIAVEGKNELVAEHDFVLRAKRTPHRSASPLPLPTRSSLNALRRDTCSRRTPEGMRTAA